MLESELGDGRLPCRSGHAMQLDCESLYAHPLTGYLPQHKPCNNGML